LARLAPQKSAHQRKSCLLTEDFRDGHVLGGIRFANPFVRAKDRLIDELLVGIHVSFKRRR
jgi:hypothetical protein